MRSYAAKLLAIRRITENSGKRTAGIDGQTWNKPKVKFEAVNQLQTKGYRSLPVRRVKIPKGKGKWRPLGIPTMKDRAMQALHLLGLDPISETLADPNSYGFRPYRSCADAIARCFSILAKKDAPVYILEGDIRKCFDEISHQWLLQHIPINKGILKQWLKSGYIEKGKLFPTDSGSPQGAIISPCLANMVLDGMEGRIDTACNIKYWGRKQPKRRINPHKIHFIRYADDWLVTCNDKDILEHRIKPAIITFLAQRGLKLSQEKTLITHINQGFDFLGQNIRKYNGKLLIKPAPKGVKLMLAKVKQTIVERRGAGAMEMIQKLNPIIRGWAMYHRHIVAKQTFQKIDHQIWKMLWSWVTRRHSNKNTQWIKQRYFIKYRGQDWTFFATDKADNLQTIVKARNIKIQRHPKIKATANPYDKADELYFEKRIGENMLSKLMGKRMLRYLYERQKGHCPVCKQQITAYTGWHAHHLHPKYLGGEWVAENLILLHPVCHIQVHQNETVAAVLLPP